MRAGVRGRRFRDESLRGHVAIAFVITVVIGSAKRRWPSARFELVEAATRTASKGLAPKG
jgi:hypothetical protein